MTTHSRHINGNLAFYDTHRKRLLWAVGPSAVQYVDDFVRLSVDDTTGDPTEWTTTVKAEAGTGSHAFRSGDGSGGILEVATAGNENDGGNHQLNGESFELTADQELYFGARFKVDDASEVDLFLGLAITDTDIITNTPDRLGFEVNDGSAGLDFTVHDGSSSPEAETLTEDIATLEDDTYVTAEFYWDGSTLEVFVDGVSVATPSVANLQAEQYRVSIGLLSGTATGTGKLLSVDWIRCIQLGR